MIKQAASRKDKSVEGVRPEVRALPTSTHRLLQRHPLPAQSAFVCAGYGLLRRTIVSRDALAWRSQVSRSLFGSRLIAQMETYLRENREMEVEILSVNKEYKPKVRKKSQRAHNSAIFPSPPSFTAAAAATIGGPLISPL